MPDGSSSKPRLRRGFVGECSLPGQMPGGVIMAGRTSRPAPAPGSHELATRRLIGSRLSPSVWYCTPGPTGLNCVRPQRTAALRPPADPTVRKSPVCRPGGWSPGGAPRLQQVLGHWQASTPTAEASASHCVHPAPTDQQLQSMAATDGAPGRAARKVFFAPDYHPLIPHSDVRIFSDCLIISAFRLHHSAPVSPPGVTASVPATAPHPRPREF